VEEYEAMSGWIFYRIRLDAGFTRKEFCSWLRSEKDRRGWRGVSSDSSLKTMEKLQEIAPRYVDALKRFVGAEVFQKMLNKLKKEYPSEFERNATT
jgi:hypothetical protein